MMSTLKIIKIQGRVAPVVEDLPREFF